MKNELEAIMLERLLRTNWDVYFNVEQRDFIICVVLGACENLPLTKIEKLYKIFLSECHVVKTSTSENYSETIKGEKPAEVSCHNAMSQGIVTRMELNVF